MAPVRTILGSMELGGFDGDGKKILYNCMAHEHGLDFKNDWSTHLLS